MYGWRVARPVDLMGPAAATRARPGGDRALGRYLLTCYWILGRWARCTRFEKAAGWRGGGGGRRKNGLPTCGALALPNPYLTYLTNVPWSVLLSICLSVCLPYLRRFGTLPCLVLALHDMYVHNHVRYGKYVREVRISPTTTTTTTWAERLT